MTVRRLTCCVCGADAGRWEQHWNRDTGYGVCAECVEWVRGRMAEKPERYTEHDSIEFLYGREGVNWGKPGKHPATVTAHDSGDEDDKARWLDHGWPHMRELVREDER